MARRIFNFQKWVLINLTLWTAPTHAVSTQHPPVLFQHRSFDQQRIHPPDIFIFHVLQPVLSLSFSLSLSLSLSLSHFPFPSKHEAASALRDLLMWQECLHKGTPHVCDLRRGLVPCPVVAGTTQSHWNAVIQTRWGWPRGGPEVWPI